MATKGDKEILIDLADALHRVSVEDLERFCEGTMNALVVGQQIFRDRFPERWQAFNDKIEAGESGFAVAELARKKR